MSTKDKSILALAAKRLISVGGFVFIILISMYIESQTNYFYYLGVEKRVKVLSDIRNLYHDDSTRRYLQKETTKLYSEIYDHSTSNIKEWRETLEKLPELLRQDLNLTEIEKKLAEIKRENEKLKRKLSFSRNLSLILGFVILMLLLILFYPVYSKLLNRTSKMLKRIRKSKKGKE